MFNGFIMEYIITIPFFDRHKWLAEIKHIRDSFSFSDGQRVGPHKLWYNYHELIEVGKARRFIDRVHYKVPYGMLGTLAHLFIKKNIETNVWLQGR